jgi:hypothetical protein
VRDVARTSSALRANAAPIPDLAFAVVDAGAEPHAAVPTLRFSLSIENRSRVRVESAMLTAQIRIAAARRLYEDEEKARLAEVFGDADQWGTSLRSLYWTHATLILPRLDELRQVALLVPCTYDFDVVAAKYLNGITAGDIPLDFFFSGSVFYTDDEGMLKTARLSWESEAAWRLPVRVWKEMIDAYFPNSAWLRVQRDVFDRLYAYRSQRSLVSWEQTIDTLLRLAETRANVHG